MAETDFEDFELLPTLEDGLTSDERLDAAIARIDGVTTDIDLGDVESAGPAPYGRSWSFDFVNGAFVRHGESPAETTGIDTLKTWCEKALLTFAAEMVIYPEWYGIERIEVIGAQMERATMKELAEAARDALLGHDRLTRVEDIAIERESLDDDYAVISLTVVTDTDDRIPLETEVAVG